MMMKYILAITLLISFIACNNVETKEHQLLDYRKEIQELKTKNQRDTFLANLYVRDQAMRVSNEEDRIISQDGYNSKEHKEFWERVNKIDLENYHQLKFYLEIHGYTEETSFFSSNAKSSFGAIMAHHHEYNDQLKILKLLIPAYKKQFVSIDTIVWIMSEMHEAKYHRLFDVGKERYTVEDEFEGLVHKLELTKLFKE